MRINQSLSNNFLFTILIISKILTFSGFSCRLMRILKVVKERQMLIKYVGEIL